MNAVSPADMLLFAAVVRDGSFTRAARGLGITKQSASERVGKLERVLGVRLLERTTRHLRLTDAGASYYTRCASIAAQIDEANREIRDLQAQPVGLLRVSAPVLYGRRLLAPIVATYMQRYPGTRIEIQLSDRRVNLVQEGFDVAIRIGALEDSSLSARRISEARSFYVASPAFLGAHRALPTSALREVRTIGMQPHETWMIDGKPNKVAPALVVNDLELVLEAALAGLGIARLPSLVCGDDLARGKLRLAFDDAPITAAVHAVYPSSRHVPAKTRVFLDLLAELGGSVDGPIPRRRARPPDQPSATG